MSFTGNAVLFVATILMGESALAREWLPEFQTLTETEQASFENPILLEGEYQSDVLTYTKPEEWEYRFLSKDLAFDYSTGSVSAAHFLMDTRLKVHHFLSDHVQFRFTYFDERNRERESVHHIVELVFWWPWKFLGISLYGEPSLYKREDDTGFALLVKPSERHEIRVFNTNVDVTRLRRNDRNDTFIEPALPYSRGVVGRWFSDPDEMSTEFIEYAVRYETKTRWLFRDQGYEYDYWKAFASFFGRKMLVKDLHLNARFQFDRKFESRFPNDPLSTIHSETWRTDRLFLTLRTDIGSLGPWESWVLTPGIEYAQREWVTDWGPVGFRDLLPHVWLKMPAFGGKFQDYLQVGYEFTWHRLKNPNSIPLHNNFDGRLEHRLNLSYDFSFRNNAVLRLIATADLDKFGTRQTWEGGCGMFQLNF